MPNPPDRLVSYDLSSFTTAAERCTALNNIIATWYTDYGVYPNYVIVDDIPNAAYVGYYD
jgi:hypothetical protein